MEKKIEFKATLGVKVTRRDKLAEALLRPINPAAVILLGVFTVLWGVWVANPFSTAFTTELYSVLMQVAPELFWGILAIGCGLITCYGAVKRRYKSLSRGAATAAWHWGMLSIFFFWAAAYDPGGIGALIFATYSGYVWLNLKVNCKTSPNPDRFDVIDC